MSDSTPIAVSPKPCPCCGAPAELNLSPNRAKVGVGCLKCPLGQIPSFDSVKAAIEAWNTRVDQAPTVAPSVQHGYDDFIFQTANRLARRMDAEFVRVDRTAP